MRSLPPGSFRGRRALSAHGPAADAGELLLHLEGLEGAVLGEHLSERLAQPGEVPLAVPQLEQETPLGVLRPHTEGVVEGAVGRLDPELAVHDEDGPPHRGHDGVGVVEGTLAVVPAARQGLVDLPELDVPFLQLAVEGGQLLVGRLHLFLGGLKLLVDALQLFVAGDGLLVRGLQLLESGVVLLHDHLEGLRGLRQLLPEPRAVPVSGGHGAALRWRGLFGPLPRRRERLEDDQQAALRRPLERQDLEAHVANLPAVTNAQAFLARGRVFPPGLLDRLAQLQQQPLAGHPDQVQARLAVTVLEERMGVATELEDVEPIVDHDAGGSVTGQQHPVGFRRYPRGHRRSGHAGSQLRRPVGSRGARREGWRGEGGRRLPGVDPALLVERLQESGGGAHAL